MAIAPAAALGAATASKLGTDGNGVSVRFNPGATFMYAPSAAARYSQIAGRRVSIECARLTAARNGFFNVTSVAATVVQAPKKQAPVHSYLQNRGDVCTLGLVIGAGNQEIMATVPMTHRGLVFLNQEATVRQIIEVVELPYSAWRRSQQKFLSAGAVILTSEHAKPPGHELGVYERPKHVYAAERDGQGVLLYYRQDGGTVTTDIPVGVFVNLDPNVNPLRPLG